MLNEVIGNYRVVQELGRGGMGVVYKAADVATGQVVALKVLARDFALEPTFVKRFKRETEALDRLDHPNIVSVFGVGEHKGLHYYAMDFVDGRSLGALLTGGERLGVERALDLAIEVATALGHAHKAGIIHRDIKPGNILLEKDGKPKLTDFGIARLTYATRMTRTGDIVGTPEYMSPEQAKGAEVDAPSDVYSLGVVLYELLAGKVPFDGATALEIIKKHQYEEPENIKEINRAVHDGLARVVMKMLAKEPKERYKSAEQVATALLVVRDTAIRVARSRKEAVSAAATKIFTAGEEETDGAQREGVLSVGDFTEKRCPKCSVVITVGDRICIECGTDLRTGESVSKTAAKLDRERFLMKVGTAVAATVPLAAFLAMVVLRMGMHYIKMAALLSTVVCIITLVGGSARQESVARRIYIGLFVGLLITILYGLLWDTSPPFNPLFSSGQ